MDGASKFVRGDAIAGIMILFINIIGGLSIGMSQHDLSFSVAMENYALLTVGDGLVAQIPSLLLSTSAAIIVTRVSSSQDMGGQVISQLFDTPKALIVTSGVLGSLGLIPGMPNLVFLALAAISGGGAWLIIERDKQKAAAQAIDVPSQKDNEVRELSWDDVQPVDIIGLEVGYRLIPLVDKTQGGQLMSRIKGVRKKMSQELGFLIQPVHIRDNLDLNPNAYRLTLMGVTVGEAEVYTDRELAINPGQVFGTLQGIETKDPAFGLDAVWIPSDQRDHAQTLGFTVVDPATVVATHLSHLLQEHAHELLGHEEVQKMLDRLAETTPKLIEDLVPKTLSVGVVVKVLKELLREQVSIRDMRTIAECLAENGANSQDPVTLTSAVRVSLGRGIIQKISDMGQDLPVITLGPQLEQLLQQSLQGVEGGGVEPGLADQLMTALRDNVAQQEAAGHTPVLLVSMPIRTWVARMARHSVPDLNVLSYNEVPDEKQVRVVATVGGQETPDQ
jgi:flagellar biosynthesis protein FlhA